MTGKSEEFWDKVMDKIDRSLVEDTAESIKIKSQENENIEGRVVSKAMEFKIDEKEKRGLARFAFPIIAAAAAVAVIIVVAFFAGENKLPIESGDFGTPSGKETEEYTKESSENIYDTGNVVPTDLSLYDMDFGLFEEYFVYDFLPDGDSEDGISFGYGGVESFMFGSNECQGFLECAIQKESLPYDGYGKACFMAAKSADCVTIYCSTIEYGPSQEKMVTLYCYNIHEGKNRRISDYNASYYNIFPSGETSNVFPNGETLGYFGILRFCGIYGLPVEYLNNVEIENGSYFRNTEIQKDWGFAEITECNKDVIKIALRFYPSDDSDNPKDFILEFNYNGSDWEMSPETEEFYIAENDGDPIYELKKDAYSLPDTIDFDMYEKIFCGRWFKSGGLFEGKWLLSEYETGSGPLMNYGDDIWSGWSYPIGSFENERGYFIHGTNGRRSEILFVPRGRLDRIYRYSLDDYVIYPGDYDCVYKKTTEPSEEDLTFSGVLGIMGQIKFREIIGEEAFEFIRELGNISFTDENGEYWDGAEMHYYFDFFLLKTPEEELSNPDNNVISFEVRLKRGGLHDNSSEYFDFVIEKNSVGKWELISCELREEKHVLW